ncbi:MAG: hypothetical protein AAF561_05255 [Planctomycetota bacterium]
MNADGLTVVAILYWLALAGWFGAVFFVVMSAATVHRTVEEADPTLPTVLSFNLEGRHAALLGGRIVGDLLGRLWTIELLAMAMLGIATIAEWLLVFRDGRDVLLPAVRTVLLAAAAGAAWYGNRVLRARAERHRSRYVEVADDPEASEEAAGQFNRDQADASSLLMVELAMLAGVVLFAAIGLGVPAASVVTLT